MASLASLVADPGSLTGFLHPCFSGHQIKEIWFAMEEDKSLLFVFLKRFCILSKALLSLDLIYSKNSICLNF